MKRIMYCGALVLSLSMMSCLKEYRCDCAYNDGSGTVEDTFNDDSGVKRSPKKAKEQCQENEENLSFFYPNISCQLVQK
ncbi:MAG: hypothetical protein HUJ25_02075 [Crocinitomicaceae bacterium]|nr:hypothetical protein [Crocinitomicaceae bacterium]